MSQEKFMTLMETLIKFSETAITKCGHLLNNFQS